MTGWEFDFASYMIGVAATYGLLGLVKFAEWCVGRWEAGRGS